MTDRPVGGEDVRDDACVNVITVLYNSSHTLEPYFEGLRAQLNSIAEVILVDNGSTDGSVGEARRLAEASGLKVRVLESENNGFAGGYLSGGRALVDPERATLCLNPDVILAPNTIERLCAELAADPRNAIITAPLLLADGTPDPASIRRHPTLSGASLYAVLGKLTPRRWRYNTVPSNEDSAEPGGARTIDATTGALMLVPPSFRRADEGIFDTTYWMYGEDLQLCLDAARSGLRVRIIAEPASTHVKGASSGLPRRLRSNRAFHHAMYLYYAKNFPSGPVRRSLIWLAVQARFILSATTSVAVRSARRFKARGEA